SGSRHSAGDLSGSREVPRGYRARPVVEGTRMTPGSSVPLRFIPRSGADEPARSARFEEIVSLIRRYDRPGPRYTSYPTAVEFAAAFDELAYREQLARAAASEGPLSLYVHLPFCEERCSFCGCSVIITKKREVAAHYLSYL